MKKQVSTILLSIATLLLVSCASVRTSSDYDSQKDFSTYKTFAFYKKAIDKTPISSLDKKRILRAVEKELLSKGLKKSTNPDLLVTIFAKSKDKVTISKPYEYGWNPWWYHGNIHTHISKYTEGTLFIELIDASKKELVWQGVGEGALITSGDISKKEKKIREFVFEIMQKYPPKKE